MTTTATTPAAVPRVHGRAGALRWILLAGCVVVLTALTAWFRYRAVGISSLWLDDAWVGVGAKFPSVGDTIRSGLTSPGFSVIYRGWATMFGDSATTAQLLTLAFAVVTPVVLFLATVERGLPWYAGLLGAGLLATAPIHIDMSTRLKQYAPEALATTAVLWVAWRVLDRPSAARRWAFFGAVAIASSLLSSIGALLSGSAFAACILAALLAQPRRLRPAIITTCAYGLIMAPWMLLAVRPNVNDKLNDYWRGFYLNQSGFAGGLGTRLEAIARGFQELDPTPVLVGLGLAAIVVVARRPLLGLLLLLPTLVAIGLAALSVVPLGTGRTDVYLFPCYALLVAVAVAEVAKLVPARGRLAVGALAVAVLVGVVVAATPTPTDFSRCRPRIEEPERRCPYPPEDLYPLVRLAEGQLSKGDRIVVYPSSGYAYGLATRYPIERQPDARAPTDWVVEVQNPSIVVLQAHREDPERWAGPLNRLTSGASRIWLIGSHLYDAVPDEPRIDSAEGREVSPPSGAFPDWFALQAMLYQRGYQPVKVHHREGAQLVLYIRRLGALP